MESYSKVKTFIFDSCPGIDWETLLGRCTGVERIRVTGIDREDDGTWLDKFVGMGGVDSDGNTTDTCAWWVRYSSRATLMTIRTAL